MNVNVTVDEVTLETVIENFYSDDGPATVTVGDRVAEAIVRRVTEDRDHWPPFRDRVLQIRDEEIREAVRPLIHEALTAPVKQTNAYGEPTGPETTLRQIILAEVRKIVTQPADRYGSKGTILQEIVREQVRDAFAGEVADEVAKARKSVSGKLGEMVAAAIDEGLRKR